MRRPTRVDNEGQACLDEVALNLRNSSDGRLALVGSAASNKRSGGRLAAERAVNTKAYLVGEKCLDASRIQVYTSSQSGETVTTILIPSSATVDTIGDTLVDESTVHSHPADS